MTDSAALLEQVLNDGAEVVAEVRYQGCVRRTSAGIGGPVILANASGQEYIFERVAITRVQRLYPPYWPPRDGELWAQRRNGRLVHWVCGFGDEDDGAWVLYPNDPCEVPVSASDFAIMGQVRREEFLAGMQLFYSQQRGVHVPLLAPGS